MNGAVKKSQLSRTYISDCHHLSLGFSVQSCLITEYPGIYSFFIHVEAMFLKTKRYQVSNESM